MVLTMFKKRRYAVTIYVAKEEQSFTLGRISGLIDAMTGNIGTKDYSSCIGDDSITYWFDATRLQVAVIEKFIKEVYDGYIERVNF